MVLKNVSHVGVVLAKHFESGSCIKGATSQEVIDGLILELTFRACFSACLKCTHFPFLGIKREQSAS